MAAKGIGGIEKSTLGSCSNMIDYDLAVHLTVIPAVLIIMLLSGLERRRFKGHLLHGRFGLAVPMGFLDGHRHRWSYTASSVAIAASLVPIFNRTFTVNVPVWAKVFMVYLQGLEIAVLGFPFFGCIGTRFRLVGGVCNTLYSLLMLGIQIVGRVQETCRAIDMRLNPASTIVAYILYTLPYVLAVIFLFIQSLRTSVECILKKRFIEDEVTQTATEHHKTYLRVCLRKLSGLNKSGESEWKFWQYRSVPGYLYPTSIMCVIAMVLTIISTAVVLVHVMVMPHLHDNIQKYETTIDGADCQIPGYCQVLRYILFLFRVLAASTYLAVVISLIVLVANILLFLRNYRNSMFKLFKGDKSFIVTGKQTSKKYMIQSMRFMGYFIAYNVWGFGLVYLIVMVLCILDGIAFQHLLNTGRLEDLFLKFIELSIYPIIAIVLFYGQMVLAKHFLLQTRTHQPDSDPPLAVDNRKFYNVLNYYLLFVNVAVGFVSCLARTASSFILTLFQVGRLDKNMFLTGWHEKDRGYASYVGMLYVHYSHNHPALRVFCSLLWDKVLEERHSPVRVTSRETEVYVNIGDIAEDSPSVKTSGNARSHVYVNNARNQADTAQASTKRRIFNRWQLTYTLLRNPSLISLRRPHPLRPEKTRIPEVTHHQSMTSRCHGWTQVIVYKISVASPLILVAIMVGIPVLTLSYFLR